MKNWDELSLLEKCAVVQALSVTCPNFEEGEEYLLAEALIGLGVLAGGWVEHFFYSVRPEVLMMEFEKRNKKPWGF